MADDVILPGDGARVATDEAGGKHFQRIKLDVGGDGLSVPVVGALPISGSVTVANFPGLQAVTGPATDGQLRATPLPISGGVSVSNFPASQAVTGPITDAQLRATPVAVTVSDGSGPLTVDGAVSVSNTVPVTGTFWQATQPVSGALTDAEIRATPLPVSGTVAVNNFPGLQAVSGPLTNVELRAAPVPVSVADAATEVTLALLAAATKLEDEPGISGDRGIFILGQRANADGPSSGTDGDYTALKIDEAGRLKVAVQPAGYPLVTGNIIAATTSVFLATSRASNLLIYVSGTFAGVNFTFEGSLNSTNGTDGNWFGVQAVRTNANTIELTSGVLSAAPAYGWELSVNGLNWFRVRATAWTSGTANVQIQPGAYATEPAPAAQISGTQPVSGTVTANIGTGSLAAGVNRVAFIAASGIWYDDSSTVLAGAATFTGSSRDASATLTATSFNSASTMAKEVRACAESDQTGTLWLEVSRDNTNWRRIRSVATAAVAGGGFAAEIMYLPAWRYWRVGFTNGATLQTRFTIGTVAMAS